MFKKHNVAQVWINVIDKNGSSFKCDTFHVAKNPLNFMIQFHKCELFKNFAIDFGKFILQ